MNSTTHSLLLLASFVLMYGVVSFVSADVATTTATVTPAQACADGLDNDFDGFIDYPSDIGCTSGGDNDETDPPPPPPPSIAGGGGGGSFRVPLLRPDVAFSGYAFPYADVRIMRDGASFLTVQADANGRFSVLASAVAPGAYVFTVIAEDATGRSTVSFMTEIVHAASVVIDNLFLPPVVTLTRDGEQVRVVGKTIPLATVTFIVDPATRTEVGETVAAQNGGFATVLTLSTSTALAAAASAYDLESPLGSFLSVRAGGSDAGGFRGDLNYDGKVNLVDLSVLIYWYERPEPPAEIDLNNDGAAGLNDISILLYHWTG